MKEYEHYRNLDVTLDPETGTYELRVDSSDGRTILLTAIDAVADVADVAPTAMEPLGSTVNTSMLAELLEEQATGKYAGDPVTLWLHEHEVTIGRDRIHIRPQDGAAT